MSSEHFFSDLPIHQSTLSELLAQEHLFTHVPADWHVVVTDIKNSTQALKEGRHEEVNLVATGCIIATLNLARTGDIQIPFFFGGDGATMVVPDSLLDAAVRSLKLHRRNTRLSFGLDLRVGSVRVSDLYASNHALRLSRLYITDVFSIPVLLGSGLSEAERIIKQDEDQEDEPLAADMLDLDGMECRWDRIKPQRATHEVVSLVITAKSDEQQAPVFKRIVDLIDRVYGPPHSRNPVSVSQLKLNTTWKKIALEMHTRLGRFSLSYLIRTWLVNQFGRYFFLPRANGQHYMQQLVKLADTLVIDGRVNTLLAGTSDQRLQLDDALRKLEREGLITYGISVSRESVMSCYVTDRTDKHIHFVDGSDGGYTLAATMWKKKKASEISISTDDLST